MEKATKPPEAPIKTQKSSSLNETQEPFASYKAVKPIPQNEFTFNNSHKEIKQDGTIDFEISFSDKDPFSISFSADDPFKDVDTNSFANNNWCSFDDNTPDNQDLTFNTSTEAEPDKETPKPVPKVEAAKPNLSQNGFPNEEISKSLPEFKIRKPRGSDIISLPEIEELNSKETIRELRLHNSILSHESSSLQAQNKVLENKIGLFERDLYHSKQRNAALNSELAKTKKQAEEYENSYKQKEKSLSDIQEKFNSSDKYYTEKISSMKQEYDLLRGSLLEAEEFMIKIENSTEKELINEANIALEYRTIEIEKLHDSLIESSQTIENLSNTIKHLERENLFLNNHLDNNFDYNLFNQKWEEDLQEKLELQKAALLSKTNTELKAHKQEIENLTFELKRQERKYAALHEKFVGKTDENIRLQTEVEYLSTVENMLTDQFEEKSKVFKLNFQQFETELNGKDKETKNVSIQNSQLEALLTKKDDEIMQLKRQVHDYEEQILKLTRDINYTKFELDLKEQQLLDIENALEIKDNDAKLQHLEAMEDKENELKKQAEEFEKIRFEYSETIKRLQRSIEQLINERDSENKRYIETLELTEQQKLKLNEMKETILDLESKLSSADGGAEMATLKQAYNELFKIVAKKDIGTNIEIPPNHLSQIPPTHNPYSNGSVIHFQPKPKHTITSDLFRSRYDAVKDDLIDVAVENFIRSQAKTALPSIKRLEQGIYLIAGTKHILSLADQSLSVKVGDEYVEIKQFFEDYKSSIFNKNMNMQRPSFDPANNRYN